MATPQAGMHTGRQTALGSGFCPVTRAAVKGLPMYRANTIVLMVLVGLYALLTPIVVAFVLQ
jgi:hypothetical protein